MKTLDELTNEIMDFIAEDWHLTRLVKEMPQELMNHIMEMIDPPFELENDRDREMVIFMYILFLIKWMYCEGEDPDTPRPYLFYAIENILDLHPEYRTERFWA